MASLAGEKSAGNFSSSGEWNDLQSFKLACWGSNPENVLRLWPIVRKDALSEICSGRFRVRAVFLKRSDFWFKFWVCYLRLQMKQSKKVNDPVDVSKLLIFVMMKSNVGAARYLLDDSLVCHIPNLANRYLTRLRSKFDSTTFVFLVNHFNEEDSKTFLNLHSVECLLRCLTWPLLQFFLPLTELVWPGFDFDANIETLLKEVLMKIKQTKEPASYENIFKTLWVKTPIQYRLRFITNNTYIILSDLFSGYDLQQAMAELAKVGQENRIQLLDLFIENANVVMSLSVEDSKYRSFKTILEKYFADKLIENYEDCYKTMTYAYYEFDYFFFQD
ncbi:hypothetical protein JTE90_020454 [Oedothorax gibbosus]|uniref:Uncharacterized protein n=1 Tax=Oedothorax gibbosus TaxID=931172 RepID=A0AAV6TRY0_9ARAC|nr:hypothetical protein JTE90_020454 [Oedothorax gibbosus]